ncbi:MFS transporter [Paenibacillus rhizovicinus]|uniref:MFS transporter n=1 Tax=Paenibacillus rhizovicinus TaxID=2704463 RepID=A0A6C0NY59_9BACL|nr:MFS transporter [Paenibacillus rhizovicinus]QHW31081.1 MFS transporter [Paenibacillus rhizovicinus]
MEKTWFKEPRYAWIGLGSLWTIGFVGALMRFIMAFFQVQISDDLGIGRGFISMAWSTNLLLAALCAPFGGWLADRYGPKRVLLISALLSTAGTGTVVFGHHPAVFFLGYGVICGLAGIGTTTTYMLIFDWFRHHRAKATGLLASASSLGLAISTPIFVAFRSLTWHDAFIVSFTLGLVVTLPTILFGIKGPRTASGGEAADSSAGMAETPELSADVPKPNRKRVFQSISAHLAIYGIVACALFACGFNMGTVEMNLVAIHQLASVPPGMIALSMSLLGVMEIAGSLVVGFMLDRLNKLAMLTLLYGIRVVGFSLLFLHLAWSPASFAMAFGFTYLSAVPGGLLIVNEYAGGKGKHTGWLLLFHQGGGILGSLVGGLSFDYFHDYQALIGADIVICMLVTLGYCYLYLSRRRSGFRLSRNKEAAA